MYQCINRCENWRTLNSTQIWPPDGQNQTNTITDHSLAAQTEVNWICVPTLQVVWTIGCAEWQSQSWQLVHNEQHSQHSRNVKVVSLYPILSYPIPTHPITGVKWNIACLQSNWVKMGPSPDQCHWIRNYFAARIYRTTQWRRKIQFRACLWSFICFR